MADDEEEPVPGEGEEVNLEEEQVREEAAEEEDAESVLTVYDPDDFFSGAVNTLDSTIPLDLLEFEHSYGYNCHKYFNLCACDETVVCWAAGSITTFMDVNTKQIWFRRSTTGGTVGAIQSYRKDPNYRIAIAEARESEREPLILLYTWPQMEIDAVLRDGTTNAYSVLDFSPDGELLASVGKEPDYNLTIWNWKVHRILLRTSAFTFDVNGVMFSAYCPGQLTTGGAAHIKFWKMAETFTGLKLKGELGRFGKTEICDVLGVYPMPDEKVLSGCEWGNVLVWEAGLVKVEVTQRGRKTCHAAPVIQFMLSPAGDEVTTIARDGCVRAWYWDTVEQSDPPEDDPYVELNPVAETCVPGCQIMCLKHQKDMFWYAQDGNGGIWVTELELDKIECQHRKVMTSHAGGVVAMAALRTHPLLVTAGQDGALMAYSTESHVLLARYIFPTPITCMLYPPLDVDETSRILMLGFKDGIMRTLLLHPERLLNQRSMIDVQVHSNLTIHSEDSLNADVMDLISLLKPHSKSITQMSINEHRTLLVTCGADTTIFMYKLISGTPFKLERLGFIATPNNVAYMTWKPGEERILLLCGQVGFIMEAVLPDIDVRVYSEITTFKLDFVSYKEILVKKHFMRHRPFPEEEDLASIDEEALKAQGEADDDEEEDEWLGEIELMESESMLGTTITWAQYCDEGIWVVQKGTGCLLLVKPGSNKILKYAPVPEAWVEELTVLYFVCEGRYLLIGTHNGYIRMVRMPTEEEDNPDRHYMVWNMAMQKLLKKLKGRRLAKEEKQPIPRIDFLDYYYLPMHDRYTGAITCLAFSSDGKRLFSCGEDGNIFSYNINFEEPLLPVPDLPFPKELPKVERAKEVSTLDGEMMSHEQLKQREEYDKMMAIANAHKKRVRDQLAEITSEYNKIIKANRMLPVSQQIDMTIDPRPLVVQERELDEAKALTVRKLAHQLEASDLALHKMYHRNIIQCDVFPFTLRSIRDPTVTIRPLRQKNLSKVFYAQLEEVYAKMAEAALRGSLAITAVHSLRYARGKTGGTRSVPPVPVPGSHLAAHTSESAQQLWPDYSNPPEKAGLGKGFSTIDHIHTLRQIVQKTEEYNLPLSLAFIEMIKRADTTARKMAPRKSSWGPPRVASFLLGLPPRRPHPLKKALRNYYQRLRRHHFQFIEEHMTHKPDPKAMPPGAAEALREAEATVGNRLLKTHPDYVAPPGHNTQLRVCLTRKEIYDMKRAFNCKVLELREHKLKLVELMKTIGIRLAEIRLEIPAKLVKTPPPIPEIDDNLEFPEKNLEVKPEPLTRVVGSGRMTIAGRKSMMPDRKATAVYPQPRIRQPKVPRFVPLAETRPLTATWDLMKTRPEIENTPIEMEIRGRRVKRHLFEQDALLEDASRAIDQFDDRLKQLQRERIRVQEKNQLMELHLYQLHREMDVLNKFEAHEDRLAERVYSKLMQVRGVQDLIHDCEQRIEEHLGDKENLGVECEELQSKFKKLVQDNKFADFLRRIFKKKYRPPRAHDDDESSESEESSSSSEEEDEGSLDSRDIGPIRLDPNICPEGCDKELYDKTFEMRNLRHRHEQNMIEQDRLVELLRKDIEAHNKVKRKLSVQLDTRKNELREFMLEKQSRMNEVEQVVILRYDQMRAAAVRGCTGPAGLSAAIVFPEQLLTRLRNRVLELQDEIRLQRMRMKINRTHLFRMNIDLKAMAAEAEQLRAAMRAVLTRKLGRPRKVDKTLDDVLKHMARRHKFTGTLANMPQVLTQIRAWRERCSTMEKQYLESLHRYSDRLRLAAALQADVLPQKPHKDPCKMPGAYLPEQYQRDVVRLRIVRHQQCQQIEALKAEIVGLRMKPLAEHTPLPSEPVSYAEDDRIYLSLAPRPFRPRTKKYFPTSPLTSAHSNITHDVNMMALLFDCLDAMRITRDDANALLQDLTTELADVIAGSKSRFEVIDMLLKKWLLKHGGDPSQYKKQTRAFDALAAVADRIMRQHTEVMEGAAAEAHHAMEGLEEALRGVTDAREPLHNRLPAALAALFTTTAPDDMEGEEAMTSLVNSLIDKDKPLTAESIDCIEINQVIDDIKECGVTADDDEIARIVQLTIECLRAQLLGHEEAAQLHIEVKKALSMTDIQPLLVSSELQRRTTRFQSVPEMKTFERSEARPEDSTHKEDISSGDKSDDFTSDEKSTEDGSRPTESVYGERSSEHLSKKSSYKATVTDSSDKSPDGKSEVSVDVRSEPTEASVVKSQSADSIGKKSSTTLASDDKSRQSAASVAEIAAEETGGDKPLEDKEPES